MPAAEHGERSKTITYSSEAEFVDHALSVMQVRFETNLAVVQRELAVGRVVPDIVVLKNQRMCHSLVHTFTIAESVVLASLRREGATRIDLLEARCGVDRTGLRDGSLKRLIDAGFLSLQRGGRVELNLDIYAVGDVVAIEAKLHRWRDALDQASAYLQFADKAYVLLPEDGAERAGEHHEAFRSRGVGLLSVSGDDIAVVVPAKKTQDHDWRREFVFSRLLLEADNP